MVSSKIQQKFTTLEATVQEDSTSYQVQKLYAFFETNN
jgi:hypothetical protein